MEEGQKEGARTGVEHFQGSGCARFRAPCTAPSIECWIGNDSSVIRRHPAAISQSDILTVASSDGCICRVDSASAAEGADQRQRLEECE